jgi:hypothetical protein
LRFVSFGLPILHRLLHSADRSLTADSEHTVTLYILHGELIENDGCLTTNPTQISGMAEMHRLELTP